MTSFLVKNQMYVNHVAAAAKLYGDFAVSDVFEVGAVQGKGATDV